MVQRYRYPCFQARITSGQNVSGGNCCFLNRNFYHGQVVPYIIIGIGLRTALGRSLQSLPGAVGTSSNLFSMRGAMSCTHTTIQTEHHNSQPGSEGLSTVAKSLQVVVRPIPEEIKILTVPCWNTYSRRTNFLFQILYRRGELTHMGLGNLCKIFFNFFNLLYF